MYDQFFGLTEAPFAITPDPRFLFRSAGHADALAHLSYGINAAGSGGFVALTGEVGTGKTTLCRQLLSQLPPRTRVALILNPRVDAFELLESICQELGVSTRAALASSKKLIDRLNRYLLKAHSEGLTVILIIDEAQNLSRDALEQIRLLTNLETTQRKLLQIILLGQPELRDLLLRPDLRQLNQRITARYHLQPLSRAQTLAYTRHRLQVAGATRPLFGSWALRSLHRTSGGVPRLINIIADRALLAAYAQHSPRVTAGHVRAAATEVLTRTLLPKIGMARWRPLALMALLLVALAYLSWDRWQRPAVPRQLVVQPAAQAFGLPFAEAWAELVARRGLAPLPVPDLHCSEPLGPTRYCMAGRARLNTLESIARPVLVAWSAQRFAVLEFSGVEVVISANDGQRQRLTRERFESGWDGRYWDVWEMPGYVPALLQEGDRGPAVLWVKAAAAKASPPYRMDPQDPYFGPALKQWTAGFQRQLGLDGDGRVGLSTLQRLSRFAGEADVADS